MSNSITLINNNLFMSGKIMGTYDGDTYRSERKENHRFRKYNGFGISVYILQFLKDKGIKNIEFNYIKSEGNTIHRFTLQQYIDSKKTWDYKGEDLQNFVSLEDNIKL